MKSKIQTITGYLILAFGIYTIFQNITISLVIMSIAYFIFPKTRSSIQEKNPKLKNKELNIIIIFLLITIPMIKVFQNDVRSQQPNKTKTTITQKSSINLALINKDLSEWSEGRWDDYQAGIDTGEIVVRVYANTISNDVAINSYCNVIGDVIRKYNSDHLSDSNIFIYQDGAIKKTCSY